MKICNVTAQINWIKHPKGINTLTKIFPARKTQKIFSKVLAQTSWISTLTKIFPARKTQKIFSKVLNNIRNAVEINSVLTLFFLMASFLLMSSQVMAEDDLPWGRDPFIPPILGITDADKDFDLTAILYSSKKSTAVINKEIVKVNDFIGNQKIVDIKKDYVVLQKGGISFRLELVDIIKEPNDIKAIH